jgi:hypothetical protein
LAAGALATIIQSAEANSVKLLNATRFAASKLKDPKKDPKKDSFIFLLCSQIQDFISNCRTSPEELMLSNANIPRGKLDNVKHKHIELLTKSPPPTVAVVEACSSESLSNISPKSFPPPLYSTSVDAAGSIIRSGTVVNSPKLLRSLCIALMYYIHSVSPTHRCALRDTSSFTVNGTTRIQLEFVRTPPGTRENYQLRVNIRPPSGSPTITYTAPETLTDLTQPFTVQKVIGLFGFYMAGPNKELFDILFELMGVRISG